MIATEQIEQEVKQEEEKVAPIAHQSKRQKMENSKGKELGVDLLESTTQVWYKKIRDSIIKMNDL